MPVENMEKLLPAGRLIFALGIFALGVLCFLSGDFIVGRPPAWPEGLALNPALGYVSGAALIIAAVAIILNKQAALAALGIAVLILAFSISRHIPKFMDDWGNSYKSFALLGGCLIVASSFLKENNRIFSGFTISEKGIYSLILIGCILITAFFISSGYAHFKFADFVNNFIPAYLPFHAFWTYFCGICLIAGGIGLLISATRKWAALLSGIMILGWFLLLHIPRFLVNPTEPGERFGLCESFTFVGILWVLAGMLFSDQKVRCSRQGKMVMKDEFQTANGNQRNPSLPSKPL